MINIVATRCHILKGKMNEIRFRLGLRPTPRCGKFAALPFYSWIYVGLLLREGRKDGMEGRESRERGRRVWEGKKRGKGGENQWRRQDFVKGGK